MGYSQNFMKKYMDVRQIESINGEIWEYSDKCFIDVCNQLRKRLKNWNYSGEPELIILQSMCKQSSINSALKLPNGIKTILKDKLFYKTFKNKDDFEDKKWRI